jgi:type VI secretion system protein ImpA
MPLREDILSPIPGENPAGIDLRRDSQFLVYERIKEARRQDDGLPVREWVSEQKMADYPSVVRIAEESIATLSKDLQLSAWLTEALLHTERFGGFRQGLELCRRLLIEFWETAYPVLEDGDFEMRAMPLNWISSALAVPLRSVPLVADTNYSWLSYQESRLVGYEEQAKTSKERDTRTKLIEKENKLAPETFDKAFDRTPKEFYAETEKDLDGSLVALGTLDKVCREKFEQGAPSFGNVREALEEVRRTVHTLLEKKREKEPDRIPEALPVERQADSDGVRDEPIMISDARPKASPISVAEPADRREAIAAIVGAASFLRRREPFSPAPYLLLRGLRWGELRTCSKLSDSTLLEAPPTDLRQKVKRLAIAADWGNLLEACEDAMSHPCSRAWLDLQRLSVAACHNLGDDYLPIAVAIQTELRALLNDVPELLEATLLDDTPAANPDTRAWLRQLSVPVNTSLQPKEHAQASSDWQPAAPDWLASASDAFVLAKQALAAGDEDKAFAIMRSEMTSQRSGRGRFRRTMQLIELAISAGKDALAQPLLDDIAAAIENHKLDAWEDPEAIAGDLVQLMRHSKKIQASAGEKQKLFERICRLDPVLALGAE